MLRSLARFLTPSSTRKPCRKPAKHARRPLGLQALESREVPATLQILDGVLTYTAANGVANNLSVATSVVGYTFNDSSEPIHVIGLQAIGSGTNSVAVYGSQVPAAGMRINLGDRNDTLTIDSTNHAISVMAGADHDTINVGLPVGGDLSAIGAPVTVDGEGGTDTVRVNDPMGQFSTYTVTSNRVTRTGGFSMNYAGAEHLTVNGGSGDDSFVIRSTNANTRTTVNAGAGADSFWVGDEADTLDGIQGTLTLTGGNVPGYAVDTVVFRDQGSSAARNYTLRADRILARTGSAQIAYAEFEGLTLNTGSGADFVGVLATVPGMTVNLNLGAGNDRVTLGTATTHAVSAFAMPVNVNGEAGTDTVVMSDQLNTADTFYHITDTSVSLGVIGQTRLLDYANVEGLTLDAGSGNDDILVVRTHAMTPVTVRAGQGNDKFYPGRFNNAGILSAVSFDGQAGIDTLDYAGYTVGLRVNLEAGTATSATGGVRNIENVVGGDRDDIIVGNGQANVLGGGLGRDILIGRAGIDYLVGENGSDLLVGDSTAHDTSAVRLENLMKEWGRTDLTGSPKSQYDVRVNHLLGVTPGGLNGTTTLKLNQVVSDGAADYLDGGSELDWYFATGTDVVAGKHAYERVNDAPPAPMVIGDVTVVLAGGNLYINEAAGSEGLKHGLRLTRLANGNIRVTGQDPTGTTGISTLVNNVEAMEFFVTGALFVNLGNGEDELIMDASGGWTPTFTDAAISMGTDGAEDRVLIWNIVTSGSLSVDTGGGDDWVFLGGSITGEGIPIVGDGYGFDRFTVNTGAGADTVTVKNGAWIRGWVDIQTYGVVSEVDADVVYFDTEAVVMRDVDVRMGAGDDVLLVTKDYVPEVYLGGLTVNGAMTIDMGEGNDRAYLRGTKVTGNFTLLTGAGADTVTMDNRPYLRYDGSYIIPRVDGDLLVQTYELLTTWEDDRDEVHFLDALVTGNFTVRMGSGDDFFSLEDAEYIEQDLRVEMDAGNDEVEISGFVYRDMLLWMGEGDDVLRLGKTWAATMIAHGGPGVDSLTKAYNTKAQAMHLLGWEAING